MKASLSGCLSLKWFKLLLKLILFLLGWVGLDDGNSDTRANSVQLDLELGLSLVKIPIVYVGFS